MKTLTRPRRLLSAVLSALTCTLILAPAARGDFFVLKPPLSLNLVVQAALENADPEDIILVHPGSIPEKVVVDYTGSNQTSLSIVKLEKNRPTIEGGLEIRNAREFLIEGFRVHSPFNDGVAAITVNHSSAVRIVDCRGKAQDDGGIDVEDTFEMVIDRCQFNGMGTYDPNEIGYGIRIRGLCGHRIIDTETSGNTYRGIWIEAEASEIRGCEVANNGHANGSAGIYIRGLQNLVRDCEIRGTEGVGLLAMGACVIKKSLIRNNEKSGIRYGDDAGAGVFQGGAISGCVIRDNGAEGIRIKASQIGCELKGNTIEGNAEAGIHISGSGCSVSKNDIRDTHSGAEQGHAILVESDGNLIHQNALQKNDGDAIHVIGSSNYLFENQSKSGKGGFVLGGGSGNAGRDNQTKGKNDFP